MFWIVSILIYSTNVPNRREIKETEIKIKTLMSVGIDLKMKGKLNKARKVFWEAYKLCVHRSNLLSDNKHGYEDRAYEMWSSTIDLSD